ERTQARSGRAGELILPSGTVAKRVDGALRQPGARSRRRSQLSARGVRRLLHGAPVGQGTDEWSVKRPDSCERRVGRHPEDPAAVFAQESARRAVEAELSPLEPHPVDLTSLVLGEFLGLLLEADID